MWHLLKLSWGAQWPAFAAVLLGGIVASSGFLYYIPELRQTPDRAMVIIGINTFGLLWFYYRFVLAFDRQERRDALLVTVPMPVSALAWARPLATLMGPAALGVVLLFTTAVVRLIIGSPEEVVGRRILILAACLIMLSNQLHLLWQEVQLRAERLSAYRLIWGAFYALLLGGLLFVFAMTRNSTGGPSGRNLQLLLSGGAAAVCCLMTLALVALNQRLFRHRHDYTI